MKQKHKALSLLLLSLFLTSCGEKHMNQVIVTENDYNPVNETVTIIFENNDGSIISNQILNYGSKIVIPKNFEKSNSPRYTYTFKGWDLNGDGLVDEIPETATASFVARALYDYTLNTYRVTFDPACDSYQGELVQEIGFGEAAIAPTDLVKQGFDFVSWDKAFDYITGETQVTAIWKKHIYQIHLKGSEAMNVNRNQDYTVPGYYAYSNSLPVPTTVNADVVFGGWKDANGKQVTNALGDLYEPLFTYDDIYLEPILLYPLTTTRFCLNKTHRTAIEDTALITKLTGYVDQYEITSAYFYCEGEFYYQSQTGFEHAYTIDYLCLGADPTPYYFDGSYTMYLFLSVDVIDYAKPSDYEIKERAFLDASTFIIGNDYTISMPFAYSKSEMEYYPDDYDFTTLPGMMYDKANNRYRTDISQNMGLLGDETADASSLTYLVSLTNASKKVAYQYTNKEGEVGTIDEDTEYGIRYLHSASLRKW